MPAIAIPSLSGDSTLRLAARPDSDMVFATHGADGVYGYEALARTYDNSIFSRVRDNHVHMQTILMGLYKSFRDELYEKPKKARHIGWGQDIEVISFATDAHSAYGAVFRSEDGDIGLGTYSAGLNIQKVAIVWLPPAAKEKNWNQALYDECKNHILPQWSQSRSRITQASRIVLPFVDARNPQKIFNSFQVKS